MNNYFSNISPVVKNLIIINILCFLPSLFYSHNFSGADDPVARLFGVYYFNSPFFRPWQIITHMFIHGGWLHISMNMFVLFSFGPTIEYVTGSKRFLTLYFICGLGAIGLQMLIQAIEVHLLTGSFIVPSNFAAAPAIVNKLQGIYLVPMIGASGAIFGVLIAFAMLFPNVELMVLFVPVPIKAKYVISAFIVYELFSGIGQFSGDDVAHFAHLGGALLGFIMVKVWHLKAPTNYYN